MSAVSRLLLPALCLMVLGAPSICRADPVEDFYKKNSKVTFLIGQGVGSSDETWARLVGHYMGRHIPGNPTIIVNSMPGAGSLVMANYLYNQAPKDGTYLGSFSPGLPAQVLMGLDNARLDPTKFNYIGSPELSDYACVVSKASGVASVDDARKKQVLMAGGGPTATGSYMAPIINKFVGTKFKVIDGYKATAEFFLAIDRHEVDGVCNKLDAMLRTQGDKIRSGDLNLLMTLGQKHHDELNHVPTLFDFITKEEDRQVVAFIRSSTDLGRPYMTTPRIPSERLVALRKAFIDTTNDPEFKAEIAKVKLQLTVQTGEELQNSVANLFKSPKSVVEQAKALLPAGAGD